MELKSAVLDSSAMLAYLLQESGGTIVKNLLEDGEATCYAHAVNLTEVYYRMVRLRGKAQIRKRLKTFEQMA